MNNINHQSFFTNNTNVNKVDLIYPELSYELVGLAFNVFNRLGYGYQEKYYQRAYAQELRDKKYKYKRENNVPIKYNERIIGRYFLDFLIDDKVVIELKVANQFYQKHIKQVLGYLKSKNLRLGLLILITQDGIKYRRIVN